MFEVLLYASLNCTDAKDIIRRVEASKSISQIIQAEVVETVKETTPECNWDAND
jgi:hypothetical protein